MTALRTIAAAALTVPSPPTPTAERYRDLLIEASRVGSDLVARIRVPDRELAACIAELEAAENARPTTRFAQEAAIFLISSWPQHKGPADPKVFAAHMAEAMAETPPDVIAPAIRHLVRSVKFLPSVADFIEATNHVRKARADLHHGATRIDRWRKIESGLTLEQRIARQLPAPAVPGIAER
jgi:hypothetical protein